MNLQRKTFQIFAQWVAFLWYTPPQKLQPALLEKLLGAMIFHEGHVTSEIMCIRTKLHGNSYYKAIEKGRFLWFLLAKQWRTLFMELFAPFIVKHDIKKFVSATGLPGTKTIPAASYFMSFLALKLMGTERHVKRKYPNLQM